MDQTVTELSNRTPRERGRRSLLERAGRNDPMKVTGWFQVAWSDEIRPGRVHSIRAFGEELVAFRAESGALSVLDAHCPHLGAHLGDGKVTGELLRCPFHGWAFDTSGACKDIPNGCKIPPRARTRAWESREQNGLVLVWHDAAGRAPLFEVAKLPGEWGGWQRTQVTIRCRSHRDVVENGVDRAHFCQTHRYSYPEGMKFETDGPFATMHMAIRAKVFGVSRPTHLRIEQSGPGYAVASGEEGPPWVNLTSIIPLDDQHVIMRMSLGVTAKLPRVGRELLARFIAWRTARDIAEDLPIWERKIVRDQPMLCDADGPIGNFRKWYRQFEAEGYPAARSAVGAT